MLRLPDCDFCLNRLEDNEENRVYCKAFPLGVPSGWLYGKKEMGQYCNNGYSYLIEQTCNVGEHENSLLAHFFFSIKPSTWNA